MKEDSFGNIEFSDTATIFQEIEECLNYGLDHGGWNSLLSLENLEEDIFLIDTAWQEAENKLADREDIKKKVVEQVNLVNDKFNKLQTLSNDIKNSLLVVGNIQLKQNVNKKKDFGFILRAITSMDIKHLSTSQLKTLGSTISLLNEFIVEYEEWVINKENNIEKLKKILRDINRMSIIMKGGKPRANFPTADQANKTTRGDGAWGWKR